MLFDTSNIAFVDVRALSVVHGTHPSLVVATGHLRVGAPDKLPRKVIGPKHDRFTGKIVARISARMVAHAFSNPVQHEQKIRGQIMRETLLDCKKYEISSADMLSQYCAATSKNETKYVQKRLGGGRSA